MKLAQLVYVSDAARRMTAAAVEQIARSCRRKNEERNITGLLIYSGGHFIQLLEGHEPVLANLFAKISQDSRHRNVEKLYFALATERLFPTWRMGLLNLDTIDKLNRSRLTAFVNGVIKPTPDQTIIGLLQEFRGQLPATDGTRDEAA
jgi:hypothetical protein